MEKITLDTEQDTQQFAQRVASMVKGGEVIALVGDLGAGKTTFTQYLAQELGVQQHINSPTFVIARHYKTSRHPLTTFVHVDAYRLSHVHELEDLGIDEHINETHSVVVIEWADKIQEYLKEKKVIWITFSFIDGKRSVILL